jgi:hypothetical protein
MASLLRMMSSCGYSSRFVCHSSEPALQITGQTQSDITCWKGLRRQNSLQNVAQSLDGKVYKHYKRSVVNCGMAGQEAKQLVNLLNLYYGKKIYPIFRASHCDVKDVK